MSKPHHHHKHKARRVRAGAPAPLNTPPVHGCVGVLNDAKPHTRES